MKKSCKLLMLIHFSILNCAQAVQPPARPDFEMVIETTDARRLQESLSAFTAQTTFDNHGNIQTSVLSDQPSVSDAIKKIITQQPALQPQFEYPQNPKSPEKVTTKEKKKKDKKEKKPKASDDESDEEETAAPEASLTCTQIVQKFLWLIPGCSAVVAFNVIAPSSTAAALATSAAGENIKNVGKIVNRTQWTVISIALAGTGFVMDYYVLPIIIGQPLGCFGLGTAFLVKAVKRLAKEGVPTPAQAAEELGCPSCVVM